MPLIMSQKRCDVVVVILPKIPFLISLTFQNILNLIPIDRIRRDIVQKFFQIHLLTFVEHINISSKGSGSGTIMPKLRNTRNHLF